MDCSSIGFHSPTPGAYSNSCPSSRWCHNINSSSVIPWSSCLRSFPASEAIQRSQFFASGGQSIGTSASASVFLMDIQDWVPLGWTGWISLHSKGLKSLLQHYSTKASILQWSAFFMVQLSHPYMATGKTIALTRCTFVGKDVRMKNELPRWVGTQYATGEEWRNNSRKNEEMEPKGKIP